ncbi:MAG: aminotransferase class I/II-fold pyridoxal phosphate-dependent enzyme [Bacteroidia bacterium]
METTVELKSKHEQVLEMMNQVVTTSKDLGIAHLTTEDYELDGRHIMIRGKSLVNFSSCSYLGLELDQRLKSAAIDAVQRFGTQFSCSRGYVSLGLYNDIENLLSRIFHNHPVILAPTTSLGHMSNIPVLVGDHDAVIMDIQVHSSVQNAVELLKSRNIHIEMIRHNNMEMLEGRIKKLSSTHKKIWYMADGVYSMFGDFLPIHELKDLLDTYDNFHLYVDDAHGMSWMGKNGSGYVLSQIEFHPKLYLVTGLAKSFGTCGGVLIFPDEESKRLVRNLGRTLLFSGPIQPPVLGASIASAKIHLSKEIYSLQNQLQDKIKFFNASAKLYELPLLSDSSTPIRFIAVSKPEAGYAMVVKLMKAGYYVNLSVFPTVSYNNTGIRIPLTLHHAYEDIDGLLKKVAEILPATLEECGVTMDEIWNAFKMKKPVIA